MSADEIRVPIRTELRGPTYRVFERLANERKTTVGALLAELADKVISPRDHRGRKPVKRWTPELREEVVRLHSTTHLTQGEVARRVGMSQAAVSTFTKALGLSWKGRS